MLIDSHAHLTDDRFNKDRDNLIRDLAKDGLELVITSGGSLESSKAAAKLANKYSNIYASVGIHPVNTNFMDEKILSEIETLAKNKKVIAIGEIGLDYHYDTTPKNIQKKWFIKQMELAKKLNLPIVVHDREANIDTYNLIKSLKDEKLTGVLHCYSGDAELAKKYVEMGFYISIAGPVTFKSAHKLKEVAKKISLDHLFIETDSPLLTPGPAGKRRNEPLFVRYVAGMIAELKGVPFDLVEKKTTQNVKRLYGIKY